MRELSLHVLDLLQNGIEAGAGRIRLTIDEDPGRDRLTITVADNGRGMDAGLVARAVDPFTTTRTTRRVGLGLPLLAAACERCAGALSIESQPGVGTTVTADLQLSHIDRAPLGDIAGTLVSVIATRPDLDLIYEHRLGVRSFTLATADISARLGDVPISNPAVCQWLREYVETSLDELRQEA